MLLRRLCFLSLILFLGGCLGKPELPGKEPGSLTISFNFNNAKALVEQVQSIRAVLSLEDGDLTQEVSADFNPAGTSLNFSQVYPGSWNLLVEAHDAEGDALFQGSSGIMIDPGQETVATINLVPANARLDLEFDASAIPGIGDTIKAGRFGIYLNPSSGSATYYDMVLSGTVLKSQIQSLSEGTYSAKIAIPNASSPVYSTPYFLVNLYAGKTSHVRITPDGSLNILGEFDSTPPTPTGLQLVRSGNSITLSWQPVSAPDLAGYRLYRTDKAGRFCLIPGNQGVSTVFTETVSSTMAYHNRISYAVSSYDANGHESLWSASVSLEF